MRRLSLAPLGLLILLIILVNVLLRGGDNTSDTDRDLRRQQADARLQDRQNRFLEGQQQNIFCHRFVILQL